MIQQSCSLVFTQRSSKHKKNQTQKALEPSSKSFWAVPLTSAINIYGSISENLFVEILVYRDTHENRILWSNTVGKCCKPHLPV